MSDLCADKSALRQQMKAVRAAFSPEAIQASGRAVAARLLALPLLSQPQSVCCYVSIRREVPTSELIAALRAAGHRVSVPRVLEQGHMEARLFEEPLVPAMLGIPTSNGPPVYDITVAICPGLAFDVRGGRLGYGAGYYDRWLASYPSIFTVGITPDEALLEEIPQSPSDMRMAAIVTPTQTLVLSPRGRHIRVVGGAWIRDGRVLAAQRGPGRAHALSWELPGGKVEPGEPERDALARELREELGVCVTVTALVGQTTFEEPDAVIDLVAYLVRCDEEPVATEHVALRWLSPHELDSVRWAPADVPLVALLRDHLTSVS